MKNTNKIFFAVHQKLGVCNWVGLFKDDRSRKGHSWKILPYKKYINYLHHGLFTLLKLKHIKTI